MYRLQKSGHNVDLQILDNKCSTAYKLKIEETRNSTFQLAPPDMHRRNTAKRMIQTFKAQFLSILSGVSNTFPNFLWDKIISQTEITLNIIRQSNINPAISAWDHFKYPFNFDTTLLAPLGSPIIIHNKPVTHRSWDFRDRKGFTIGPALEHYRCFQVVNVTTKSIIISDTIKLIHDYLTQPEVTSEDRIIHTVNFLSCAVKDASKTIHHEQLSEISNIRELFTH